MAPIFEFKFYTWVDPAVSRVKLQRFRLIYLVPVSHCHLQCNWHQIEWCQGQLRVRLCCVKRSSELDSVVPRAVQSQTMLYQGQLKLDPLVSRTAQSETLWCQVHLGIRLCRVKNNSELDLAVKAHAGSGFVVSKKVQNLILRRRRQLRGKPCSVRNSSELDSVVSVTPMWYQGQLRVQLWGVDNAGIIGELNIYCQWV